MNETIAARQEIITTINASIADIEAALSIPVLDGTPFLIIVNLPALQGVEGYAAVLGDWPKSVGNPEIVRGFRSLDVAPTSLCGCILSSPESADKKVAKLQALGHTSARKLHRRDFLVQRLASLKQLLTTFTLS